MRTTFSVENFTTKEAAEVIAECAGLDNVPIDPSFASALAEDLAESGYVRPPELQIVCTALVNNPTILEYRFRGGARGILSNHIKDAIKLCANPVVASQILRALCDFPKHVKRVPQTARELVACLEFPTGPELQQTEALVEDTLNQFEAARVVVIDTRHRECHYALIHDYLVDAVAVATSATATKTEKANQLLQYYIAEYSTDRRTRIPSRLYRFIKKYADKQFLIDSQAKRLLKASKYSRIRNALALASVIVVSTLGLLTFFNTTRGWEAVEVDRQFPEPGIIGQSTINVVNDRVLTFASSPQGMHAMLWDPRTAKVLLEKIGTYSFLAGDLLLTENASRNSVYATQLSTGETFPLPISAPSAKANYGLPDLISASEPGQDLILFPGDGDINASKLSIPENLNDIEWIEVWSVTGMKRVGLVRNAQWSAGGYINKDGTRLLNRSSKEKWTLWNTITGKPIQEFRNEADLRFDLSTANNHLAIVTRSSPDKVSVKVIDFQTTDLIAETEVEDSKEYTEHAIHFSPNGDFVVLTHGRERKQDDPFTILRASNLQYEPQSMGKSLAWAFSFGDSSRPPYISWTTDQGTYLWDLTNNPPKFLPGLKISLMDRDGSGREGLFIGSHRVIAPHRDYWELYDLESGKKLANIQLLSNTWYFNVTVDNHNVVLQFEGGRNILYNLDDGRQLGEISGVGTSFTAFYDSDCHRLNVWTSEGRVLRYSKVLRFLGRWTFRLDNCG